MPACAVPEAEARSERARSDPRALSPVLSSTRPSVASPPLAPPGRPRVATGASTRWSPQSASSRRPANCGRWETPHSAAGPALRELVLGSEGALGVIPDVTVRVRPAPEQRRYEAWMAESFAAGCEIVRSLAQGSGLARRDPGLRRGGDREHRWRSRARAVLAPPSSTATSACGGAAGAP